MMIFITIIQPKIHKSNEFPQCFHLFYFNRFFTSKYFLSGHNFLSEAVSHFFLLIDFRSTRTFFLNIFSEAAARSLKKHWNVSRSSHTIFNIKKYQLHTFFQKQSHKFFHGFCTKYTNFVSKIFHNIFEGWLKNFVKNLTPSYFHTSLGRFARLLTPILRILGNFSIILLATNLCSGTLRPAIDASSGLLSLPEWSCGLALVFFWHPVSF